MRARSSMAIACCLGTLVGVYAVQVLVDLLLGIDRRIKYDAGMVVGAMMLSLIFQVCSGLTLFCSLVEAKVMRLLLSEDYSGFRVFMSMDERRARQYPFSATSGSTSAPTAWRWRSRETVSVLEGPSMPMAY
jgi:hypothetical protein